MRSTTAFIPSLQRIGLFCGPALGILTYLLLPVQYQDSSGGWMVFSHAGRATTALLVWMAAWWMTEATDLAATALLPVAMLPILRAADMRAAAAPYASDLIFLFMGGFIMALAMQRWGLDRRIALITLRLAGSRPANMVGGCMLATALITSFVSNTATAAMMLPIGLSVVALVRERNGPDAQAGAASSNFAVCVVLGIAYAASIGGVTTLIGTPPNTFLAAFLRDEIVEPYRREIGFTQWMMIGVPLTIIFLPVVWLMLTRVLYPMRMKPIEGGREFVTGTLRNLGPMNRGERVTFVVFLLTALTWMLRQFIAALTIGTGDDAIRPFAGLTDPGIAVLAALALLVIPAGRRLGGGTVMDWTTAAKLPWRVLILFGGGLSLAAAIEANGVAEFLGSQAHRFNDYPPVLLVLAVSAGVVLFTEVASNTATATTLIPILAAIAPGLGVHPYLLIFPATIAASFAFMMPVGTPPNAMAMATGMVTMRQMIKAGIWLNLLAITLITLWTFLVMKPLLID